MWLIRSLIERTWSETEIGYQNPFNMVKVIFIFSDGEYMRFFNTTFDALCEVTTAYNMCKEYFIGARFADDKEGKYINVLDAEETVKEIFRFKEYLQLAIASGFDDSQIVEDINTFHGTHFSHVLPSWKQYMEEYWNHIEETMINHDII